MGPIAWSTVALVVCGISIYVVVRCMGLRRECARAGSAQHAAEHAGELTPKMKTRPLTWFRLDLGFTVFYWGVMFAFYLTSLGSAASIKLFFAAFFYLTLPAVLISLALTLAFLSSARKAVDLSTMRGPLVTKIESRASILAAGWAGVALFMVFFSVAAVSKGL